MPPMPASAAFAFFVFAAESPFVRAEDARSRALGEREQPRPQRFAIERLHRVEQRQQENRRQVRRDRRCSRAKSAPAASHHQSGEQPDEDVDQTWPPHRRAAVPIAERLHLVGDPAAPSDSFDSP